MIRRNKPVKLMEWGEGTNTLNQIWMDMGEGKLASDKQKNGLTTLVFEMPAGCAKRNPKDNTIKICQQGEGMTPSESGKSWGEVSIGDLKSIENLGGKTKVTVEVKYAAKIGSAKQQSVIGATSLAA